jgi:hypothetical protein
MEAHSLKRYCSLRTVAEHGLQAVEGRRLLHRSNNAKEVQKNRDPPLHLFLGQEQGMVKVSQEENTYINPVTSTQTKTV